MTVADTTPILDRLKAHELLGTAPDDELRWLIEHGRPEHHEPGTVLTSPGQPVGYLYVLFTGAITFTVDRGGAKRKINHWRAGGVTGVLPYSRMGNSPGEGVVDETVDLLAIDRALLPELTRQCPEITARLIHVMVDRARTFTTHDLQDEKMVSLGKLSATIAHELNNPAAAAVRSAKLLRDALDEAEAASRALGATALTTEQADVAQRLHDRCIAQPVTSIESPMERADREDAITDWLDDHGVSADHAGALAATGVSVSTLDELARAATGDALSTSVRWIAAGCAVRSLGLDVERAATRVYDLVSAVKRFTYMDRATVPEPMAIGPGIADTVAVLGSKARGKMIRVTIDVPESLPQVSALGGELNQVWLNLIDNALDAAPESGHVTVRATRERDMVVVRVIDDGPGIPLEIQSRIFDAFFTTKPVGQGTGIGLETARKIIQRHDGLIDFDTRPGHTEMRVAFPAVPSAPQVT